MFSCRASLLSNLVIVSSSKYRCQVVAVSVSRAEHSTTDVPQP